MLDLSFAQLLPIELALFAISLAAIRWEAWQRSVVTVERVVSRWAERPLICFGSLILASILIRLALLSIEPLPQPLYHDEFSYLLGADTFFHGRLTNPVPPVPVAFETIHINISPTYQSMYLPGTALWLSVGKMLGSPWFAVVLMTGLLCGISCWMVSGWLPKKYGAVAGILAIGITGSMNWWFDNYFCIALLSVGVALVLGSLPRIAERRNWRATVPLAVGLLVLMLTRPYEGFCVTFPCVLVLLWSVRNAGAKKLAQMASLPVVVLSFGCAWLLYYNWRGTGHPLLFPYMTNFAQYHITGPFLFSAKHALPSYHLDIMRRFYMFAELPQHDFMQMHPWEFLAHKIAVYYMAVMFGFGLPLVVGLVFLARSFRELLWTAPLAAFAGFALNVILMAWAPFPQYVAPAAPLLLLIVMFGFFGLRTSASVRFNGRGLVRGFVLAGLMLGLSIFGYRVSQSDGFAEPQYVSKDRARVAENVLQHTGKQLCLVRYTPLHESWQEWVFNGAEPQEQRLIWARSIDADTDRQLIAAFPGRQVWLVKPDYADDLVSPYSVDAPFPLPEYGSIRNP